MAQNRIINGFNAFINALVLRYWGVNAMFETASAMRLTGPNAFPRPLLLVKDDIPKGECSHHAYYWKRNEPPSS